MQGYILRRLLLMIPTLLGVTLIIFTLMRVLPGDFARLIVEQDDPRAIEIVRKSLGLDKPLHVQYVSWLWESAQFKFGKSFRTDADVSELLKRRLPLTLQLSLMSVIVALLIGIPGGIISALRQNTFLDYLWRIFSMAGLSIPSFWAGFILILALIKILHWKPPLMYVGPTEDLATNLSILIWPALITGFRASAIILRLTRSSMLDVIREDYIRTARAKGLSPYVVTIRHALRNALLPVVTVAGMEFAFLIGGLVVTEQVFNLPGLGKTLVQAIDWRDYHIVQSVVVVMCAFVIVTNLAVDLTYRFLDPRISYESEK